MKAEKFLFRIIPPCHHDASMQRISSEHFLLEEDTWGDNDNDSSYYLHVTRNLTGNTTEYVGMISILKSNQQKGEKRLLSKCFPNKVFTKLPAHFVSISFSVELFMAVAKYLTALEMRQSFIDVLHLIVGKESSYYMQAKNNVFFQKSVLRGSTMDSDVFSIARHYLEGISLVNVMEHPLTIHLRGFEPFEFGFKPSPISDPDYPNRIIAFIGKNGTGKSTAIYKIAKILYASPEDRRRLKDALGYVEPGNAAFTRLLVVSYSAFDNFIFPGIDRNGYTQLFSDDGLRRFRHIGVRHLYEESSPFLENSLGSISYLMQDRTDDCVLKPFYRLASEVSDYYLRISNEEKRVGLLNRIHQALESSNPILYGDLSDILNDPKAAFPRVSTGHKFFAHALLGILASIEPGSLILFDEPENHMHPPLISTTIKYIRWILDAFNSYMFVATHSPVVIQELFAQNVYVVKRSGEKCSVSLPKQETYGENLGLINSEIFDLTTDVTSFHNVFDKLYEIWECDRLDGAKQVIDTFQEKLGTMLSNQMISYLIGKKLSKCGR